MCVYVCAAYMNAWVCVPVCLSLCMCVCMSSIRSASCISASVHVFAGGAYVCVSWLVVAIKFDARVR